MSEYVGRKVRKIFDGFPDAFQGKVGGYDSDEVLWSVKYDDGDCEELEEHELLEVLVEEGPEGDVSDGDMDKAAKKKKKNKRTLLQLQKTRRELAMALGGAPGSSGGAVEGTQALQSPAGAAAEKHAKKQRQKLRSNAPRDQDIAAPDIGKPGSDDGKEAARTLKLMSGRSGQSPQDTATGGKELESAAKGPATVPAKGGKTRSLQKLSAGAAPNETDIQSEPEGQIAPRARGRPRKNPAPSQNPHSLSVKPQQKDVSDEGNAAEEFYIPLEQEPQEQIEAEEGAGMGEAEPLYEQRGSAGGSKRGAGKKAAASESAAAKEPSLRTKTQAASEKEMDVDAGALGIEVAGIIRGAPTSGPLAGPTSFHNYVVHGGTAYIAGQTARDPSVQDYKAQTKQVLQQLENQLIAAGSSKDHLLKVTVLLKDIAAGAKPFNATWQEWINPEHAPARITFQASLIHPDLLVEVDALAALPTNLDMMRCDA